MADLRTHYLGIELKNPIIVGASNLCTDVENLKKMEAAGAAAIVYKSLFEEQIQWESLQMEMDMQDYNERNAEMTSLFPDLDHAGPKEFLFELGKARKALSIPLIASINAVSEGNWVNYAREVEATGVAAIELNFYQGLSDAETDGRSLIEKQIAILRAVKDVVSIPVSVKLSPFYTNIIRVIDMLDEAGADGFVMFNRLFQPDINIDEEKHHFPYNLSSPEDTRLAIRYAGALYGEVNGSICANGGIFGGRDVIATLLAGADTVQVVSTLYKNHISHISTILHEVEDWMEKKAYADLNSFRGKLSRKHLADPFAYTRAQYIDILMKSEQIFNKYPMV